MGTGLPYVGASWTQLYGTTAGAAERDSGKARAARLLLRTSGSGFEMDSFCGPIKRIAAAASAADLFAVVADGVGAPALCRIVDSC